MMGLQHDQKELFSYRVDLDKWVRAAQETLLKRRQFRASSHQSSLQTLVLAATPAPENPGRSHRRGVKHKDTHQPQAK